MTDQIAQLQQIAPELLRALMSVLSAGYGEVVVRVVDHKVDMVEEKKSVKVRKDL